MSITTVLFDLDGTLLPMDQDAFVKDYFFRLAGKMASFGYDVSNFKEKMWFGIGAMLKNSGSEAVEFLSWLTFAEGGLNREGAGVIGGILGKGCTAVLLSTLFSGGFANTAKGIGSLFRNEGKGSLIGTLLGIITGASACLCFMGIDTASASSSMAGISGALLCLQAIGRKDGNLYQLAESLTSRKISGLRSARPGKAKSLLSGISMGFILMTAVAAIGV